MKSKNRWKQRTQKFLFLKLRTATKTYATQARQSIAAILPRVTARPGPVGGNAKRERKEFVGVLKEYRQAKPGAESALSILDEALQVKLSTSNLWQC